MRQNRLFPRNNDPRWLTVRYRTRCQCCQRTIEPGEQGFYWPASRSMDCSREDCGRASAREFNAAVQDEETFASQYARPF